jgi:hypothetical protein
MKLTWIIAGIAIVRSTVAASTACSNVDTVLPVTDAVFPAASGFKDGSYTSDGYWLAAKLTASHGKLFPLSEGSAKVRSS